MTRRFWIALLLSALGLAIIGVLAVASASRDDDRPDADVDAVVGSSPNTPASTP